MCGERETVKVAGEGCDHVVTEMYGSIALLKQRGQDLQSHRLEVFFGQIYTCPSHVHVARFRFVNQ